MKVFAILGAPCCEQLAPLLSYLNLSRQADTKLVSHPREASRLLIIGLISAKLLPFVNQAITYLPKNHTIVHIRGCEKHL